MALLTRIRARLGIHARRRVLGLLDGGYASIHTGRSMDFNDLREYVPGDEIKDIDWKASARNRVLLVKRYVAERKHTVMLAVATGRSMAAAASPSDSKADLAVLCAGMVGYLALRHSDYVGLVTANAEHRWSARPSTREVELERMLSEVMSQCRPDSPDSDPLALLDHAITSIAKRTIMLIVLDDIDLDDQMLARLRRLGAQHEVLVLSVADLDVADPGLGGRALSDLETGRGVPEFVRNDALLSAEVAALDRARASARTDQLDALGIACVQVRDADGALLAVQKLLERHRHVA